MAVTGYGSTETNTHTIDVFPEGTKAAPAEPPILSMPYIANAAAVAATVAFQSFIARYYNKNDFTSEEAVDGKDLAIGLFFPHFINKLVINNWRAVGGKDADEASCLGLTKGEARQMMVLTAYTTFAVALDLLNYYAVKPEQNPNEPPKEQPWPVGQASVGAIINSMGFVATKVIARILGKKTYTAPVDPNAVETEVKPKKKEKAPKAEVSEDEKKARQWKSYALVAAVAGASGVASRYCINSASTLGTVFGVAMFEIFNKIMKGGAKAFDTTQEKMKNITMYGVATSVADISMGVITSLATRSFSVANLISSTTTNGLVCTGKLNLKAWLDRKKTAAKAAPKAETTTLLAKPEEAPKAPSIWNRISSYVVNLGAAAGAVALNNVNVVKNSVSLLYATALTKHNVVMLSAREMYQNAGDSRVWRTIAAATPVAFAGAADVVGSYFLGVPNGWIATGTAVATAGTYLGMAWAPLTGDKETDD